MKVKKKQTFTLLDSMKNKFPDTKFPIHIKIFGANKWKQK